MIKRPWRPNGVTQRLMVHTGIAHIVAAHTRQARPPIRPAGVCSTKDIRLSPHHRTPYPPRSPLTRPSLGIVRCHFSILAAWRLLAARVVNHVYPQRMDAAAKWV